MSVRGGAPGEALEEESRGVPGQSKAEVREHFARRRAPTGGGPVRVGVVATVPALYGLAAGWWTPRGPVTVAEAVAALVLGLVVGVAVGIGTRTRWAMLLAPAVFGSVFELVRLGATGPTVDGIHLDNAYGWIALISGRGVHGLLTVAPMVLGAAVGAGWTRRRAGRSAGRGRLRRFGLLARRTVAAAVAVLLLALTGLLLRPASTEPIVGAGGEPLPGSVAELTRVSVGDRDLSMMIRGEDVENPVLLFLTGGPGGSELGAMRRHGRALERDFVVATLDQRGTGTSYDQIDPLSTMTLASAVEDVLGVSEHLRQRFGGGGVYLVGQSWGTVLGVRAAQERPDLYAAYVGVGQMVDPRRTDEVFYTDTLAWARDTGRTDLVAELERIGPPPYADLMDYPTVLGHEQNVYPYDRSGNAEGAGQMAENLPVAEYSFLQTVNIARGLLDTFAVLYPQVQGLDLRRVAAELDVPVYLVQGRHEPRGRADLAREWFAMLDAPSKQWVEFPASGHRPLFEQPDLFHEVLTGTVLAETADRS